MNRRRRKSEVRLRATAKRSRGFFTLTVRGFSRQIGLLESAGRQTGGAFSNREEAAGLAPLPLPPGAPRLGAFARIRRARRAVP